jgi:Bacterial virulence factor lipase N-terminal
MFESRNRPFAPALAAALVGIALAGCDSTQDGPETPPPPTEEAFARFDINLAASVLDVPYPYDLYFAIPGAPVDGTLNIPSLPWRSAAMTAALNSQDGWSTNSSLTTGFSLPLDPASISGSSVKIIKLWLDPTNKAPATNPAYLPTGATSFVAGVLTYGTDFTADVSPDVDSGGTFLRITPLKPLDFSTGPAVNDSGPDAGKVLNVGYLVVLTDGLAAASGTSMGPSALYESFKSAPADCSTVTDATLNQLCLLTKAHLGIAQLVTGTNPSNVILTWSFSTQSIDDVLDVITKITTPQQTLIVPSGLTTAAIGAAGKADIYVGSTKLPYYLTPPSSPTDADAVLRKFWTAENTTVSSNLTMFNPRPFRVADVTVPLVVTIPNAGSACPGKPANGWPVAIVQHGITGNRGQALTMADAYADACFVVVSMDLPLHGIRQGDPLFGALYCSPALPQCIGATERTFDVDLVNNTTGVAPGDGIVDASGTHMINLTSPATGRDNLRQAEADLIQLTKSIPGLAIPPGTPAPAGPVGVDPTRISFTGLSLGAIVGGSHVHFTNDLRTATLSVPGGVITKLLLDSQTFGPRIKAGVTGQLTENSFNYNLFFRDFQAVIDSGDPINHIKDAVTMHPVHLIKVLNDTVVPNSATDRLIAQGGLTKLTTLGPNAVGPGNGGYTFFSQGSHGSLFDPTASLAATVEMQRQAVLFGATAVQPGGPFVVITDTTVLDLD